MLQPVPRCRYIWLNEGRTACYYLLAGESPPSPPRCYFAVLSERSTGGLAPIASTKPPHLRQDGPPGWDGENGSSDQTGPRGTAPGPCSLPVYQATVHECADTYIYQQPGLCSLPVYQATGPAGPGGCSTRPAPPSWPQSRLSNEAAPFPTQFPARWECAGVRFPGMRSLADISLSGAARWECAGVGFPERILRPSRRRRAGPGSRPAPGPPLSHTLGPAGPDPGASIRVSAHDRSNLSETDSRGSIRFCPTGRRAKERGEPRLRGRPAFSLFT